MCHIKTAKAFKNGLTIQNRKNVKVETEIKEKVNRVTKIERVEIDN